MTIILNFFRGLRLLMSVFLLALVIGLAVRVVKVTNNWERDAAAFKARLTSLADQEQRDLHNVATNTNAILLQAGLAADEARRASMEQRVFLRKVDGAALDSIRQVNATIAGVGRDVHGLAQDLHGTSLQINTALAPIPALLNSLRDTVDKTGRLADNADIPRALAGLADTTEQANRTLAHVSGVAAHLETMSADVDKSLHRTLNPSKKSLIWGATWSIVKVAAGLAPLFRR